MVHRKRMTGLERMEKEAKAKLRRMEKITGRELRRMR
jgi:hypothetical protein